MKKFLLLLMLAYSNFLYAQDSLFRSSVQDLMKIPVAEKEEETVTTATRSEMHLNDAPASMTIITQADIAQYGYRNLSDALKSVPEVYTHFTGYSTSADFRSFWVNQFQRRTLYLLDGVKMNDRFHFGDFESDIVGDLSNVERIEVIRGTGAAVYGTVSVLGVVNIITKKPKNMPVASVIGNASIIFDEMNGNSIFQKSQINFVARPSTNFRLNAQIYWFNGNVEYDTKTQNSLRPWNSSFAKDGAGIANIDYGTNFWLKDPNEKLWGGKNIPNFNIGLSYKDFSWTTYWHSYTQNWIGIPDNGVFNAPKNQRPFASGGTYLEWKPSKGFLAKTDFWLRAGANIYNSSDLYYYSTSDYVLDATGKPNQVLIDGKMQNQSLFRQRFFDNASDGMSTSKLIRKADGTYYDYNTDFRALANDQTANLIGGGGGTKRFAGSNKSVNLEFYMMPYKSEKLTVSVGANFENASYYNLHWFTWANNELFAYSSGIADNGWYVGAWTQAFWTAIPHKLSFTAGLRYDYQRINEVYRHLGGQQQYTVFNGNIIPFRKSNQNAADFSPRLSGNFYYSKSGNIRFVYSHAFRSVPPQEIIRLPFDKVANSEQVENFELMITQKIKPLNLDINLNAFYTFANTIYQWNAALHGFSDGQGWNNSGITLEARYQNKRLNLWANATLYQLNRATDSYSFMRNWKDTLNWKASNKDYNFRNYSLLPITQKPLDSPQLLVKFGGSYLFATQTSLAWEAYYNGEILTLIPTNQNINGVNPAAYIPDNKGNPIPNPDSNYINAPNYLEYKVPASFFADVTLRQSLDKIGMKGLQMTLKVRNIFDQDVWYINNDDAQSFSASTYSKTNQLAGFGRRFMVGISKSF